MSFAGFLSAIASPFVKTVQTISTNKAEIKKRQIERIVNADDKVAEWEAIHAENSRHTWLNDWFSIILSVPLIGAFVPPFVPFIHAGFDALNKMPSFYQYWVAVAILSSFGVRAVKK